MQWYNKLIDITYYTNPVKGTDARNFGRTIVSIEMDKKYITIKYATSSDDTIIAALLYKGSKNYENVEGLFTAIDRDNKIEELGI